LTIANAYCDPVRRQNWTAIAGLIYYVNLIDEEGRSSRSRRRDLAIRRSSCLLRSLTIISGRCVASGSPAERERMAVVCVNASQRPRLCAGWLLTVNCIIRPGGRVDE